ncbi:MAG: SAM-dependent DNA methyltransferase [Deltaproteobacteria bacterium]|nr:SAM-dependent DNA methyltransferase [Deltaproteobacteria bacterium]
MDTSKQNRTEFGDFQTPIELARNVCSAISRTGFRPASVIEPTCGIGAFVRAALEAFPHSLRFLGFDLNSTYIDKARTATAEFSTHTSVEIDERDFFQTDWNRIVKDLPQPVLILGNPPWVTNAALGVLGSNNLPTKANIDNLRGIEALTGSSNFDISEWMLRENLQWLQGRKGMLAVLCKTSVARKVLAFAWENAVSVAQAAIYRLDAKRYFGASVDACLLLIHMDQSEKITECADYVSLHDQKPASVFGWRNGKLVADVVLYEQWRSLTAPGLSGWRSGIKHDCSKVFELRREGRHFVNESGESIELEEDVVFPLLKSSDLATSRQPRLWMLVPQRTMNQPPPHLEKDAPKAWKYLTANSTFLDRRASTIYKKRAPFSIFGVGPYSFAPWKVAISGLYKKLEFARVAPFNDRPVVLDDTCYFFPCHSEEECNILYELVQSLPAREYWSALVFWDAKRPITARLLNSLDLAALARELGKESKVTRTLAERQFVEYAEESHQQLLFREDTAMYESTSATNRRKAQTAQLSSWAAFRNLDTTTGE